MRTPAGFECRYFYANYFRGRNKQECRLIGNKPHDPPWSPGLCRDCPVPKILSANACTHLVLDARVTRGWAGLSRRVTVEAACTKTLAAVPRPATGCGSCHENLDKLIPPEAL